MTYSNGKLYSNSAVLKPRILSLMPQAKNFYAISRQWEILKYLADHRQQGRTVRQVMDYLCTSGYPVSKRTVDRDLKELQTVFAMEVKDSTEPYRWYLVSDKRLDLSALTLTDALSLKIIESLVRPLLPAEVLKTVESRFLQAQKKLETLVSVSHAKYADKVAYIPATLPLLPPSLSPSILNTIQNALLQEKQIAIEYDSPKSKEKIVRTLNPLALVVRGVTAYLVATSESDSEIKRYALHRIGTVKLLEVPMRPLPNFDLSAYIASGEMQFFSQGTIQLVATTDNALAMILTETPLSPDQNIVPRNGSYTLRATVPHTLQLEQWILAHAEQITVQKPKALREKISDKVKKVATLYS